MQSPAAWLAAAGLFWRFQLKTTPAEPSCLGGFLSVRRSFSSAAIETPWKIDTPGRAALGEARAQISIPIKAHIEDDFAEEIEKTATLTALCPELGERGRAVLETKSCLGLARLDEVFAAHMAAEEAWQETCDADEDALMAICAHRCATMEEAAIKVRYLAGLDSQLEPDQSKTFFASFLPEEEEIEAPV